MLHSKHSKEKQMFNFNCEETIYGEKAKRGKTQNLIELRFKVIRSEGGKKSNEPKNNQKIFIR